MAVVGAGLPRSTWDALTRSASQEAATSREWRRSLAFIPMDVTIESIASSLSRASDCSWRQTGRRV